MSTNQTQLTVLMTVYNGSPFLRTAIDSVLNQTYNDFLFSIVDDASTDDSREIVRSYDDPRIQLYCLETNVGQTAALNIGLRLASTPWIARMDADDFSGPTRFEEQMRALQEDRSVRCLGTYAWVFRDDPGTADGLVKTPTCHEGICDAVSGSPIIHGSIIINREAMLDVGAYDEEFRIIADVDLYDRLLPKYMAANLPKALLGVRRHSEQASNSSVAADEIIKISFRRLEKGNYSAEGVSSIRAELLQAYLLRARYSLTARKFLPVAGDISRAVKVKPKAFMWMAFKVFVVYNVPQRYRSRLKGLLTRIAKATRLGT
jgi:glycosyltransferase involved in cell wall biosynthesis